MWCTSSVGERLGHYCCGLSTCRHRGTWRLINSRYRSSLIGFLDTYNSGVDSLFGSRSSGAVPSINTAAPPAHWPERDIDNIFWHYWAGGPRRNI